VTGRSSSFQVFVDLIDVAENRKWKLYSKNFETPSLQLICCIIHVENVFVIFNILLSLFYYNLDFNDI
jgi:hypothetical protein